MYTGVYQYICTQVYISNCAFEWIKDLCRVFFYFFSFDKEHLASLELQICACCGVIMRMLPHVWPFHSLVLCADERI